MLYSNYRYCPHQRKGLTSAKMFDTNSNRFDRYPFVLVPIFPKGGNPTPQFITRCIINRFGQLL